MGPENAAMRGTLMDAVESVMREKGYGAISARSIAEYAGIKHQLVYYYYSTIEDLLLATYRRRTGRLMEIVEAALSAEQPIAALWEVYSDPYDSALTLEYMALSNHSEVIRLETASFGEQLRQTGLGNIAPRAVKTKDGEKLIDPVALTYVLRSIGAIMGMEGALGIFGGHQETRALIQWCLGQLEPGTNDARAEAGE
jgi:AcrR family transcriptional regulator